MADYQVDINELMDEVVAENSQLRLENMILKKVINRLEAEQHQAQEAHTPQQPGEFPDEGDTPSDIDP